MVSVKNRRRIILLFIGFLILVMTGGWVAFLSNGMVTKGRVNTPTPTPVPGLVVYGNVKDRRGVGVAGVNIYRKYAIYQAVLLATTDEDRYYQSDFYPIPGDEMVSVWAEGLGLTYEPEHAVNRYYFGFERSVGIPVYQIELKSRAIYVRACWFMQPGGESRPYLHSTGSGNHF